VLARAAAPSAAARERLGPLAPRKWTTNQQKEGEKTWQPRFPR
jgi:hypothetical protein